MHGQCWLVGGDSALGQPMVLGGGAEQDISSVQPLVALVAQQPVPSLQ
jgi:hypothetical protein